MPALTAQQAQLLALSVRDYAHTSSDFLHNQWDSLTPDDRQLVHDTIFDLLLRADDLNALAGILTLDSAQSSVDQINAAVVNADQFLQKIAEVKKGIGVITAGLGLATAVASKNPTDIVNSLKALKGALA